MNTETLYKALRKGGESPFQGYRWPLPSTNGKGWTPGEWVGPVEGELEKCENGLHCCTRVQLVRWLYEEIYVIEPADGTDRLEGSDKTVLREARLVRRIEAWNETTARLFAADCAEMVLPIVERAYPDDDRPRKAIEAARQYALGEIGTAAWAAARGAARGAARDAARGAAWTGARGAARAAALAAARDAARDAARGAARGAAWAAARGAARGAARDAAWDAAWAVFTDRLMFYLERGEEAQHEPLPEVEEVT